ncbi:MAG: SOS response-associated peptidase family protein [Flavobacteriales bacterium]|nr:SOS response-associated peptidase family protein [Flavobacteriales bacterium]
MVYTNTSPLNPISMTWGLIPHWTKSEQDKLNLWNGTLNCRSESMFEKPSFRDIVSNQRCLLYVDGFFEYHHHKWKKISLLCSFKRPLSSLLGRALERMA